MSQANFAEEPLKNIDLESAVLGLRMALTPEEEVEARQKFLNILKDSILAVPTLHPVPVGPDGTIVPGSDISVVIAQNADGLSGVPAFTTLGRLRMVLEHLEHGMFLSGLQLAGILAGSENYLFVDGPDLHAAVTPEELQGLAQAAQMMAQMQQQAAERNERLEVTIAALQRDDTAASREAVAAAFMEEFCRLPVAGEQDANAECIILNMGNPETPDASQEIELLTVNGLLPCFTSEEAMRTWDAAPRNAVILPGPIIAQLAAQAGVPSVIINAGSSTPHILHIEQNGTAPAA